MILSLRISDYKQALNNQTSPTTAITFQALLTDDPLIDGIGGDKAIDDDGSLLTDAMSSILRLQIALRIPIRVVDDHRVRRHQIQAQSTGAGG